MVEEWLVDGCNLLHAIYPGKSNRRRSDRASLLSELAGFAALNSQTVLVVLDGAGEPGELDVHHTKFLRVVYSQKSSADACIEKLLYERRGQARFKVVTDDRAVGDIALGSGAVVIGTAAFVERLRESRKDRSDAEHKNELRARGFHRPFEDKLKDP